ncbi:MAG: hypothetical protein A2542_01500 [Parcubacteria group bacterium RIFOXYD2_FULL_52_8]|nr:MAG: hypothetical protein A2542_01500 [Parcubacteria group bacterium RIFOXYD2_FULL_52_8]
MPFLAIQVSLAKVALSLQALLLLVAQIQAEPVKNANLVPVVQRSLSGITTTLRGLGTQLAATSNVGTTMTSPARPPATPATEPPAFETLNTAARAATVNILCTTNTNGPVRPISGSGVIIDPRGVILTNAHVAQYFLLKDYQGQNSLECVIRAGSPAVPAYRARLLYISPAWVATNVNLIRESHPTGTGEDDFALLQITSTFRGEAISTPLPYVPFDPTFVNPPVNDPVLLASYPAELTGGILVLKSLDQVSSVTKLSKGYYFHDNGKDHLDLIEVSGSLLSQGGSSGGGVVRLLDGKLIGIIVTTTTAANTSERELFALTASHIGRRFREQQGISLSDYFATDLSLQAQAFEANVAPRLRSLLLRALGL